MKTFELHIDLYKKPQTLAGLLKNNNIQFGDRLSIRSFLNEELVLLVVLSALNSFKKSHSADKVLQDIFENKNSKEIQQEIQTEFGVSVEITTETAEKDWHTFSKEKLAKAYGDEEPEYDVSMVKEHNADYKK